MSEFKIIKEDTHPDLLSQLFLKAIQYQKNKFKRSSNPIHKEFAKKLSENQPNWTRSSCLSMKPLTPRTKRNQNNSNQSFKSQITTILNLSDTEIGNEVRLPFIRKNINNPNHSHNQILQYSETIYNSKTNNLNILQNLSHQPSIQIGDQNFSRVMSIENTKNQQQFQTQQVFKNVNRTISFIQQEQQPKNDESELFSDTVQLLKSIDVDFEKEKEIARQKILNQNTLEIKKFWVKIRRQTYVMKMKQNTKYFKFQAILTQQDIQNLPNLTQQQLIVLNQFLKTHDLIFDAIKYKKVDQYLEHMLQIMQLLVQTKLEISFLNFIIIMGHYLLSCNEIDKAAFFLNDAMLLSETTQNYSGKCQAFIGLSKVAMKSKMQRQQIDFLKKALQYSLICQSKDDELEIYDLIGQYYYQHGEIVKSLYYHKRFTDEQLEDDKSLYRQACEIFLEYYERDIYLTPRVNKTVLVKLSLPIYNIYLSKKNNNEYWRCDETKTFNYKNCSSHFIIGQIAKNKEMTKFFVDYQPHINPDDFKPKNLSPTVVRTELKMKDKVKDKQEKKARYLSKEQKFQERLNFKQDLDKIYNRIQREMSMEPSNQDDTRGILIRHQYNPGVVLTAHNYFILKQSEILREFFLNLS